MGRIARSNQREGAPFTGSPSSERSLKSPTGSPSPPGGAGPSTCPPSPAGSTARGCDSACIYGMLQRLPEGTTVIETAENNCWQESLYLEQTSSSSSHGQPSTLQARPAQHRVSRKLHGSLEEGHRSPPLPSAARSLRHPALQASQHPVS